MAGVTAAAVAPRHFYKVVGNEGTQMAFFMYHLKKKMSCVGSGASCAFLFL
jgi:hypothetical protein